MSLVCFNKIFLSLKKTEHTLLLGYWYLVIGEFDFKETINHVFSKTILSKVQCNTLE